MQEVRASIKPLMNEDQEFWQLWLKHEDYLRARCQYWMGGNIQDAQDALSQAQLKAWDKGKNYLKSVTKKKAWLTRFVHNHCVDIHRKRRRGSITVDDIEIYLGEQQISSVLTPNDPQRSIEQDELKQIINQALEILPPELKAPIVLRFYHQLSCHEIAYELDVNLHTVYKRISDAKKRLRKQISKYLSGEKMVDLICTHELSDTSSWVDPLLVHDKVRDPISYSVAALCLEAQFLVE